MSEGFSLASKLPTWKGRFVAAPPRFAPFPDQAGLLAMAVCMLSEWLHLGATTSSYAYLPSRYPVRVFRRSRSAIFSLRRSLSGYIEVARGRHVPFRKGHR